MRKVLLAALTGLVTLTFPLQAQVTIRHGQSLSQLLNNLYGGNGIQLKDTGHQAHFGDSQDFQQFSETLQAVLQSRSLYPLPPTTGVISYTFNEETGTYTRATGSFGPVLADRASTTGIGNINFSTSYTIGNFETINGNETTTLTLRHCLTAQCVSNIASPYLQDTIRVDMRMRLKSQAWATSIVYGLTNKIDIGIVIPYLRNDLQVFTHASIIPGPQSAPPGPHAFEIALETPDQLGSATAIGIGDITARAKYQLASSLPFDLAVLGDLILPSGDQEDFLGTGATRVKGTLIASKQGAKFAPHLNAGVEYNIDDSSLWNIDYRIGSEIVATPRLTIVGDLLGVIRPSVSGEFTARALEGQELIGQSEIDAAIGGKWEVNPTTLLVMNVLTPLNTSGIRPSASFTLGLQIGF